MSIPPNPLLSHALSYAARGWRVFPAIPKGKRPLIKRWQHEASTDPAKIKSWWQRWPNANIAIATGGGLLVLDVDYNAGGSLSLRQLREISPLPKAPVVETARGCHYYFSDGVGMRNRAGLLPGLDLRGEGGFVIAPPSIHPSGLAYSWGIAP